MEGIEYPTVGVGAGILAVLFAISLIYYVLKQPEGTKKMREISYAIREGALAYLHRQYKTVTVFAIILAVILVCVFGPIGPHVAIGFLTGAFCSALAGYIGMNVSVRANIRTAEAAKKGLDKALTVAVRGGTVTGMFVVGLALLGVSAFYIGFQDPNLIIGFGFGASLISLFARVGGGIYTKAADVGADLVGKVEAGIPEDDPRNPAVIADNVGDNVGDCAGMAADLFETYVVTVLAAMILGYVIKDAERATWVYVSYPLALGAVAIVGTIIGTLAIKLGKSQNIMGALYKGLLVAGIVGVVGFYFITMHMRIEIRYYYAAIIGLFVTVSMVAITEYYTSKSYRPVKIISDASKTGAGTNIITGFAVGLESTVLPVIVISGGIMMAYYFGELYGIAIASASMLSLTGMIVAIDSYGPITDNGGGIAEMASLPENVRNITDRLDAVGNTTKAVTKGYAIGSAALGALALFAAYTDITRNYEYEIFNLTHPAVIVGLFIGALLPFFFSSLCMMAVGRAAFQIVEEVRRQFREIKGLMDGKARPEYARCVDIVTLAAQKEMIAPALLAVAAPILVGFIIGPLALGGLLIGVIASGLMMALLMCTGGAAWDNAKKLIEEGKHGGKGSDAHKAAVVGDTVGDPFKDTAGPALNSLIKVINMIALLFAAMICTSNISVF